MHSLRALLSGIVDYAGLFPPAKLDMGTTVRNFAKFRGLPEEWMLGRLVVPVAQLAEFEREATPLLPTGDDEADLWVITAIAAPAGDPQCARDLEAIEAFNDSHLADGQGAVFIDTVELKAGSAEAIDSAMERMSEELFPYFELPLSGDVRGMIAALAGLEAGAKVRTGGITADAFPSTKVLAEFIAGCAAAEIPFKATAGLHHPLRRHDADLRVHMHGFLNVFVAGCVAFNERLVESRGAAEIERILSIDVPGGFRFDDEAVSVLDWRLATDRVTTARERFAHSFGSCSFDEPLADLRSLSLLQVERTA